MWTSILSCSFTKAVLVGWLTYNDLTQSVDVTGQPEVVLRWPLSSLLALVMHACAL